MPIFLIFNSPLIIALTFLKAIFEYFRLLSIEIAFLIIGIGFLVNTLDMYTYYSILLFFILSIVFSLPVNLLLNV